MKYIFKLLDVIIPFPVWVIIGFVTLYFTILANILYFIWHLKILPKSKDWDDMCLEILNGLKLKTRVSKFINEFGKELNKQ